MHWYIFEQVYNIKKQVNTDPRSSVKRFLNKFNVFNSCITFEPTEYLQKISIQILTISLLLYLIKIHSIYKA